MREGSNHTRETKRRLSLSCRRTWTSEKRTKHGEFIRHRLALKRARASTTMEVRSG